MGRGCGGEGEGLQSTARRKRCLAGTFSITTGWQPRSSMSCRATFWSAQMQTTGTSGRYLATSRAVSPVLLMMMIVLAWSCRTAATAAQAVDSYGELGVCSTFSPFVWKAVSASAAAMIDCIISTDSTGY